MPFENPLIGAWTYRSFLNVPVDPVPFDNILFGEGTLTFTETAMNLIAGTIGTIDPKNPQNDWMLDLTGWMTYGNPMTARFEGRGKVGDELWIYDYVGYLVNQWPNGVDQVPAIVGSVIRTIPHGANAPAGFVASFIAVRQT